MVTEFLKIVCEEVSPFEKEILVDTNCKDINEAFQVFVQHPELFVKGKTWILYPMTVETV